MLRRRAFNFWPTLSWLLTAASLACFTPGSACAQFTTIINVPPNIGNNQSIGSDTQVNMTSGSIGRGFDAGNPNGTSTNVEVNIVSGVVDSTFQAFHSSVNIFGGTVADHFNALAGSVVTLHGGEFRIDGIPIAGLDVVGSTTTVTLNPGSLLSGTLSDGTPFAFSSTDSPSALSGGTGGDKFTDSQLILKVATLPPADQPSTSMWGIRGTQTTAIGGNTKSNFNAGWGSNLTASTVLGVGANFEAVGATITIPGGIVRDSFDAFVGSNVQILDGQIQHSFEAHRGSVVTLSGGTYTHGFSALDGSTVKLVGSEFRINGELISDLNTIGDVKPVNLSQNAVVSGTFIDGRTFAFSVQEGDVFADGTLLLVRGNVVPVGANQISLPSNPAPKGLRQGQTLVVASGGTLPQNFVAGYGSSVLLQGGTISGNFEAVGANVTITSGSFGGISDAFYGSNFSISGGTIGLGSGLTAWNGSVVNVSGGAFQGSLGSGSGGTVNISGGSFAESNSHRGLVNISGGTFSDFVTVLAGGIVNVSGGKFLSSFEANANSHLNISGGSLPNLIFDAGSQILISGADFRIDGMPVAGLNAIGDSVPLDIPLESQLTGVLADGTPFAVSARDCFSRNIPIYLNFTGDSIANGTLRLELAPLPAIGPSLINSPSDPIPPSIRDGQVLVVTSGGSVPEGFNAGRGSSVFVNGGNIGNHFEAIGANVEINGGAIGDTFDAFDGTSVNLTAGSIGKNFDVFGGSTVNIRNGTIGDGFQAYINSAVNLYAGSIGSGFASLGIVNMYGGSISGTSSQYGHFSMYNGQVNGLSGSNATYHIAGGTVSTLNLGNGVLTITGGTLQRIDLINVDAYFIGGHINGRITDQGGDNDIYVSGGSITNTVFVRHGSHVGISGGAIAGEFDADADSGIDLFGTQFALNGTDITSLLIENEDFLIVERDMTLAGTLADGTPFDFVLNSTNLSGQDFFHTGATLTITLVSGIPGDYNSDGTVNAADYTVWRNALGTTVAIRGKAGDGNFDGKVTQADYFVWQAHFGESTGQGPAIPEPASVVSFSLAAISLIVMGRRRSRFTIIDAAIY